MSDTDLTNQNYLKSSSKNVKLKPMPRPTISITSINNNNVSNQLQQQQSDVNLKLKEISSNQSQQSQGQRKIKIEYERVGSFEVFETVCPLEHFPLPPTDLQEPDEDTNKENELKLRKSRKVKTRKNTKNLKNMKRISIIDDLSSDSEDEVTTAFNLKMQLAQEKEERARLIPISMDAYYRTENANSGEPVVGEATVYWARGDFPNVTVSMAAFDGGSESEMEAEIEEYIEAQNEKKRMGENLSGEFLWYDQERSIIRNLHNEGSISLTSYDNTDERIFGKTEIFDAIMTCEERAMLRARDTNEAYMKVDKKKVLEGNKKGSHKKHHHYVRPKDQGDWL